MDIGIIHNQKTKRPVETEKVDMNKLYFKNNHFLLSEGKIYLSKAHWLNNQPIQNFNENVSKVLDVEEFWTQSDRFYFTKNI